jgi:Bacterial PH domain
MVVMARSDRATFRLPAAALFFPVLLMFCITPLATSGGAWAIAFVVPVIALIWVVVTRTTATAERVTAYRMLGARRMTWAEMDGLEFAQSRWAVAVGTDGRRVRLPMVRPRDLPRLAAVSGGSLNLGGDQDTKPADADGAAAVDQPAETGGTAATTGPSPA